MEKVLDIYKRPYDPMHPVICMDDSPKQLIGETRISIPMSIGHDQRCDYEYERLGVCNIFSQMNHFNNPLFSTTGEVNLV